MKRIAFTVYGRPQQRGSKRPVKAGGNKAGRTIMLDDNKRSKPWMAAVTSAAAEQYDGQKLLQGPVRLSVVYYFRRPKSHFGTGRNSEKLKPSAPKQYTSMPDLSKLMRALEDALTGVVWNDDRQVSEYGVCMKTYTTHSERAEILIEQL